MDTPNEKLERPASSTAENASSSVVQPTEMKHPRERSTLSAAGLILTCFSGLVINTFTITSVSIALPDIGRELHIEQDRLQWVVSAFALSSGCFLLLCGRLADLYGRKLVFLIGSAWFGVFALGGGFAKTEVQINILRGLQGVGSAATIPAALGILAHSFPPSRQRSIAFAIFSAGAPTGGGLGLTVGGVLTQFTAVTWKSTFYLTAGLAALSFIAGALSIDPDQPSMEVDKRVDWIGAALVTSGLVLITFVLGQGELASDGWKTPYIIALLIVGVFLVLCFVYYEHYLVKRTTRAPLMRLELWTRGNGKFAAMQIIAFLEWCAFMSWILWAQLYYQNYKGYTPVRAMVRLLPMTITGLLLNLIVGFIVGSVDVLWLLISGTVATGGACLLFALINPNSVYWAFGFPAAILAVGGADFIFACGTLFVARVALPQEQSVAGGLFQTLTQLGTAVGLAITTVVHNKILVQDSENRGIIPNKETSNVPPEILLTAYKAAQWAGFGFAMGGLVIAVLFLRGIGIVGDKGGPPKSDPENPANGAEKRAGTATPET